MNDADIMANAYAAYAQSLATFGSVEKTGILDQLQTFLKTNGVGSHVPISSSSVASSENSQGMDTNNDRDDGVRPACRFCGKTFAQASYIKAHERLHTEDHGKSDQHHGKIMEISWNFVEEGEKPYVCSVCNKAFSDASNWKKHERMHSRQMQTAIEDGVVPMVTSKPTTPEPSTPSSPSISGTQFTTAASTGLSLASQISSFSAQLAHMSSTPANTIASLFPEVSLVSSLTLQNSPHNSNSSSSLQNCDEGTDLSPPMKRNKEDSLSCNICGKVFSTPASLSMHKKIHSGEKPHVCRTCGKAFTQIGTLRAHERVHTGEKPYECNYCGKTFAQCGSFRMHERRHQRDLMDNFQKCFICGASCANLEELQKHMMCHPGALSLPSLHPGALGFPGAPLPIGFGLPHDLDAKMDITKSEPSEMSEIEKAFNLYAGQPKSAPAVSLADHFQMPPFASTAHALIQRSLSQGSDPSTAVSMFLASNGGEGVNLFNPGYNPAGIMTPARMSLNNNNDRATPVNHNHEQPKNDEVEPVSTTTRSRKYSSDSHTSLSIPDGPSSDIAPSQSELSKGENGTEEGEQENETNGPSLNQNKAPSEDSSLAESRSTEDFHSDDQTCHKISRKNLNRSLISSSNSRKQKRPMRRLSSSTALEHEFYTPQYNEEGEEIIDEEKLTKDQMMVSFLIDKGEVYKCEHCHIIFEDCTLYLLHNGFHANDTDPFKCVICKKSCDGRVEFNCHLTSHIK